MQKHVGWGVVRGGGLVGGGAGRGGGCLVAGLGWCGVCETRIEGTVKCTRAIWKVRSITS